MGPIGEVAKATRAWACYDCGKCTASCPIARAGGGYSPRRHVLTANLAREREVVANDTLFACLTCSLCDLRCPVQVRYTELIRTLREQAHLAAIEPECPHGGALQSMMRMMARGGTTQDRLGWLADDLRTEREAGEVFLWTGCTVYYDAFFPELGLATLDGTRAAVRLLNRLGITPVVSPEERCCGHDLLWNGDRESFELLARHNVRLVAESGAKLLVTPCAECLRTWKLDYQSFFSATPPRMVHLSELIAERLADLALKPDGGQTACFQDPCRLGRHLGIYEAPRKVLAGVPGLTLVEMRRAQSAALCCAGGTWSGCDRYSKRIQVERLREARESGADVLVTACPKCQIHFRCAMKDPNLHGEIEIELRDIAEVVAARLP